jgi:ribosomal protein S18 acetylase RimI-like enzyme
MQTASVVPRSVTLEWPERFSGRDVEECVALLNEVVRTSGTNGFSRELTRDDGERLFEGLEFAIRRGEAFQLFARDESSRVIGIATLYRYKQPDRKHVVEISRVAIAPERRGEFLMAGWREVLRKARSIGVDLMAIDVSEDGPVGLWERLGFRTWGVMKDYARVGNRRLDGYYMAIAVSEALAALDLKRGTMSVQCSSPGS